MKHKTRKLLSILIALIMVLGMLPATALAEPDNTYPVWVGSTQVTEDNKNDVLGDGTVSYTPGDGQGTLTFATASPNIIGSQNNSLISARGIDLAIVADNGLTLTSNAGGVKGIDVIDGKLTIDGNIDLTVMGYGIDTRNIWDYNVKPDITINGNVKIKALDTTPGYAGGIIGAGAVRINGDVDIYAYSYTGIYGDGVYLEGNTIKVTSVLGDAIVSFSDMAIKGDVIADARMWAILADNGNIELDGNVTARSSEDTELYEDFSGIGAKSGDITLRGGDVTAEGYVHGIFAQGQLSIADTIGKVTANSIGGAVITANSGISLPEGYYAHLYGSDAPLIMEFVENSSYFVDETGAKITDARIVVEPMPNDTDETRIARAAEELRQQLINRVNPGSVTLILKNEPPANLISLVYSDARNHKYASGDPKAGDYLLRQIGGYNGQISKSFDPDLNAWKVTFTYGNLKYYTTKDQEDEMDGLVSNLVGELGLKSASKSDYEKVKAIHDWMKANVEYDVEHMNDSGYTPQFTAYAALKDRKAVCQGYTNLFYRLAMEAGIDARIICGDAYQGGEWDRHAWNIVKLGDYYYPVDVTWDAGAGSDEFFLTGYSEFAQDHEVSTEAKDTPFWSEYEPLMAPTAYGGGTDVSHDVWWKYDSESATLHISDTQVDSAYECFTEAQQLAVARYDDVPWKNCYESCQSVEIEGNPAPVSTANWFNSFNKLTEIKNLDQLYTSSVTKMMKMFFGCRSLSELDLSNFNISSVTDMAYMFSYCESLKTVYAAPDADWSDSNSDMTFMFEDCDSLAGGAGTACDGTNNISGEYARIDGLNNRPGYFTEKSSTPTIITRVDFTVAAPVVGKNPSNKATIKTTPAEAATSSEYTGVWWFESDTPSFRTLRLPMSSTATFKTGKYYMALMTQLPTWSTGYEEVDGTTKIYINGVEGRSVVFVPLSDVTTYDVWVGDIQVTDENKDDVLGDAAQNNGAASVKFTPAEGENPAKLTLTNATIEGASNDYAGDAENTSAIYSKIDLKLELNGVNTIYAKDALGQYGYSYGLYGEKNLIVSGPGSLYVNGAQAYSSSYGVRCTALTMEGGYLAFGSGKAYYSYGVYVNTLNINGGKLIANGGEADKESYGVRINNLNITNGALTANSGKAEESYGVWVNNLNMNAGAIFAEGGETATYSYGIYAGDKLNMDSGVLSAKGGETATYSYGIVCLSTFINGGAVEAQGSTLAFSSSPVLHNYTDGYSVLVNEEAASEGAQPWSLNPESPPLGGTGSIYKYVKIIPPSTNRIATKITDEEGQEVQDITVDVGEYIRERFRVAPLDAQISYLPLRKDEITVRKGTQDVGSVFDDIGKDETRIEWSAGADDFQALGLGSHTLVISYAGDDIYAGCSESFTVNVIEKEKLHVADFSPATAQINTPYTVSGRILDESDNPVADIFVQILKQTGQSYYDRTDENGYFSVEITDNVPTEAGTTFKIKIFIADPDFDYAELNSFHEIEFKDEFAVTAYDLWVGGIQVTDENKDDVMGDAAQNNGAASVVFTPAEGENPAKLTLTNAEINGIRHPEHEHIVAGIYGNIDLNIELNGENTITGTDAEEYYDGRSCGIFMGGYSGITTLTITGNGSLNVTGAAAENSHGICARKLIVENGTITAISGDGIYSYGIEADDLTVKGGMVTACGYGVKYMGVGAYVNNLDVKGGSLTAVGGTCERSHGIYLGASGEGHAISVTGGTVTAIGNTYAFYGEPKISGYTNPVVFVSVNADGTEGSEWQEGNGYLGGDNSTYKYVKIAPVEYDLWIGGVQVTGENMNDVMGDAAQNNGAASVKFTPAEGENPNTLTLTNANITGAKFVDDQNSSVGINSEMDLTLVLEGTSTITGTFAWNSSYGIYSGNSNLTVTGGGTLNVTAGNGNYFSTAINVSNFSLEGGTVNATGNTGALIGCYGMAVSSLTVTDGVLTAVGKEGIKTSSEVVIKGGTVTVIGQSRASNNPFDLTGYTNPLVTVNENATSEGATKWNDGDGDLGGSDSTYKYIKIEPRPASPHDVWWKYDGDTKTLHISDKQEDADYAVFTEENQRAAWFATIPWYGSKNTCQYVTIEGSPAPVSTKSWFDEWGNLEEIQNLNRLDTSSVTDMNRMFFGFNRLTELDLSGFNTSNVTDMRSMFYRCSGLTELDLSGFDTSNVTDMTNMFYDCSNLETIYAAKGADWCRSDVEMRNMFSNCDKLKGGAGTVYDADHIHGEYARIDGLNNQPGYFTAKVEYYDVWVGGVRVTSANMDDVMGDAAQNNGAASVKFTPAEGENPAKLTLTNAQISGKPAPEPHSWHHDYDTIAIYSGIDLELALEGESFINAASATGESHSYGIYFESKNLTVSGSGSLTVNGEYGGYSSCGVSVHSLIMEGGSLTATGGSGDDSYGVKCTALTMKNGSLTATGDDVGNSYGVKCTTLTMEGGSLIATGGQESSNSYGVDAEELFIDGGTVEASGQTAAFKDAPDLDGYTSGVTVLVSGSADGANATDWEGSPALNDESFKYVKIEPTPVITYDIWVQGVQVTEANKYNVLGDDSVKYTPATATELAKLTLTDATITGKPYSHPSEGIPTAGVYSLQNLELELVGDSTINCTPGSQGSRMGGDGINVYGHDLTISGEGSLTVNGPTEQADSCCCIYVDKVTLNSGTVRVNTGNNCNEGIGVYAIKQLIVNGGALYTAGKDYGIDSYSRYHKPPIIKGGTVEAIGESKAFGKDPDLTGYDPAPDVTVSVNTNGEGAEGWNEGGDPLGGEGSVYKYVKIAPASSTVKEYPIYVGDVRVTDDNKDDVLGDGGSVKYTPATATTLAKLTLTNANFEAQYVPVAPPTVAVGVYHMEDLMLELVGESTITGRDASRGSFGIIGSENGRHDLTVTGEGSLTVTAGETESYRSCGLEVSVLTMESGTLIASGGKGETSYGVFAKSGIKVTGGTLQAYGGQGAVGSYGIACSNFDDDVHTISGGTVEASGQTWAFNKAPDLEGYIPKPTLTVSVNANGEGAEVWNEGGGDLGGEGSLYKYVKIAPAGSEHTHEWGTPSYKWSDDLSEVTATRICSKDASHFETETVKTSSTVTKPATDTEDGVRTYTATFKNSAFENQTKTETIPRLTPVAYRIIFNANGGKVNDLDTYTATTGADGKLTSLPTPVHSGNYEFDGWYTEANGGTKVDESYKFTEDTEIFAHWKEKGSYIPGDINGDEIVNNKDITRLMRYIKYKDVSVVEKALDVNGDGKVNNKDITRLMRYIKYKDVRIY